MLTTSFRAMRRAATIGLIFALALVATPAQAEEQAPCAPTAIVFDFCERVPGVEYPGDNGGTVTPRPEDIIGKTMLCPDGSYGTVVDLDYNMDCTVEQSSPQPIVVEAPPAAPAAASPTVSPPPAAPAVASTTVSPPPAAPAVDSVAAVDVMTILRELFGRLFGWLFAR